MKGPGIRIDNEVRRVFQCPACGAVRRVPGDVLALKCACGDGTTWMKLQAEPKRRPLIPEPRPLVQEFPASDFVDPPAPVAPATAPDPIPSVDAGTSDAAPADSAVQAPSIPMDHHQPPEETKG